MIVAGTGHRPNKLWPGKTGYEPEVERRLLDLAYSILHKHQPEIVVSGFALGWDMALAEAALSSDIDLCAAIPFIGQERMWPEKSQEKYNTLLELATEVKIVCEGEYAPWKMQKRNEWMVDRADKIFALWDGSNGGTGNCIAYAKKVGKPIVNFWPSWEKFK